MTTHNFRDAIDATLANTITENQQKETGRRVRRILRRLIHEREAGCRNHLFTQDEAVLVIVALHYAANGLLGTSSELAEQISHARAMGGKNDTLLVVEEAQD